MEVSCHALLGMFGPLYLFIFPHIVDYREGPKASLQNTAWSPLWQGYLNFLELMYAMFFLQILLFFMF